MRVAGNRFLTLFRQRRTLPIAALLIGLGVFIATGWSLVLGGDGPTDHTWQRIQHEHRLVVAIDPSYPPFASAGESLPEGLDADLALALGNDLDAAVEFSWQGYDGLYDALILGYVDVIISALRPDPRRTDLIYYTQPYVDAGHVWVGRAEDFPDGIPPLSFDNLDGQTVAVEFASEGDVIARRYLETADDATFTLEQFLSTEEALQAVVESQVDIALVDRISAGAFVATSDVPLAISKPVINDPYVIAIRRKDWQLARAVEASLKRLIWSGELDALIQHWLGEIG